MLSAQQKVLSEPLPLGRDGRAGLPVPNWTKPYWLKDAHDMSPAPNEGSEGSLTDDADICVIGSGISGVATVYHLGRQLAQSSEGDIASPVKVVILDARDFCEYYACAQHVR